MPPKEYLADLMAQLRKQQWELEEKIKLLEEENKRLKEELNAIRRS